MLDIPSLSKVLVGPLKVRWGGLLGEQGGQGEQGSQAVECMS